MPIEEQAISPVLRSKAEAKANYNRLSRWYDLVAGWSEKKYRDAGLRFLAAQSGESIVEIGFGTGHCLLSLAEAVGEVGHVHGVDISEGMKAIAMDRVARAGFSQRVTCYTGDAAALTSVLGEGAEGTSKQGFDAIFVSFALELFDTPELPVVLSACREILRNGGRLCIVSLFKPTQDTWPVRVYEWAHRKMPRLVDCRPIQVVPLLREAGLQLTLREMMSMWGLPVEIVVAHKLADDVEEG